MEKVLEYLTSVRFLISFLIIVLMFVLLRVIKKFLIHKVAYTNKDEQHQNTLIGVLFNTLQYAVVIIAVVLVLNINGVNVISILAGLGIMSAIVGLALQDTLKDIFSGMNIYMHNFYKIGDVVRYNNQICEVKYFNVRVTKFRDLLTGSTFTVCNSLISSIEKIKETNAMRINFSQYENPEKIKKAFESICKEVEALYGIRDVNSSDIMFDDFASFVILFYKANPREYYKNISKIHPICIKEFNKQKVKIYYSNNYLIETLGKK